MEQTEYVTGRGFPVVVSAPSGGGKTSLCRAAVASHRGLVYSISVTSRLRREIEQEGHDYFFVSRSEFERKIENGELAEWTEYQGSLYGTPRLPLERAIREGETIILDLDVRGARQLKALYRGCVSVFVLAPSLDDLAGRLRKRGRDSQEVIENRLASAVEEMKHIGEYDYAFVNADFQQSVERLRCIIEAEKCRVVRKNGT